MLTQYTQHITAGVVNKLFEPAGPFFIQPFVIAGLQLHLVRDALEKTIAFIIKATGIAGIFYFL